MSTDCLQIQIRPLLTKKDTGPTKMSLFRNTSQGDPSMSQKHFTHGAEPSVLFQFKAADAAFQPD